MHARAKVKVDQLDQHFWRSLCVAYQPIVHLDNTSGEPWGYEALVRRKPPRLTNNAWDILSKIRTREDQLRLFRFMLSEALGAVTKGFPRVSVNVEPFLVSAQLEAIIMSEVEAHGVSPKCLVIELTERSSVFDGGDHARAVIGRLATAGIQIFLDDFFAGENNLDYLMKLDLAGVKFDSRLARSLPDHSKAEHILRNLNTMMGQMGITTIIEGIEDGATAEIAIATGSTLGQGYAFGRPQVTWEGRDD